MAVDEGDELATAGDGIRFWCQAMTVAINTIRAILPSSLSPIVCQMVGFCNLFYLEHNSG